MDEHYILEVGVIGDIALALDAIAEEAKPQSESNAETLRQVIVDVLNEKADDNSFPLKPQRILSDVREGLANEDILISDVGDTPPCQNQHRE